MSSRKPLTEKPRVTVSEIVEQDKIIRHGFEARVGAPLPLPERSRSTQREWAPPIRYMEERMALTTNEFARNGLKAKSLSQKQRDEWWGEYDYNAATFDEDRDPTDVETEEWKWSAYCILIGIPPANRIGSMFLMLPDDRQSPRSWPVEVVFSVTTGKLLCKDLAQFTEFMVWFAGGWPDTFAGELDKKKAQRLFVDCAAQAIDYQLRGSKIKPLTPKDVAKINKVNHPVMLPALLAEYPPVIELHPAKFTELMMYSGAK